MIVTDASSTGHPAYSNTFPCSPGTVTAARRFVRIALSVWGLDELADDGQLIVSELASNAVRHTKSRNMRVSVTRIGPALVRVGVVDQSRVRPQPHTANDNDVRGRGLMLVDRLTVCWGTDRLRRGKRVWAEFGSQPAEDIR